jgi:hypothetical protein
MSTGAASPLRVSREAPGLRAEPDRTPLFSGIPDRVDIPLPGMFCSNRRRDSRALEVRLRAQVTAQIESVVRSHSP